MEGLVGVVQQLATQVANQSTVAPIDATPSTSTGAVGNPGDVTTLRNAPSPAHNTRALETGKLQSMVIKLIETSASPATNRQYQQQWVSFVDFHQKVLIPLPFRLPLTLWQCLQHTFNNVAGNVPQYRHIYLPSPANTNWKTSLVQLTHS